MIRTQNHQRLPARWAGGIRLAAVLAAWFAVCLPAADVSRLKPMGYVSDFAGVVDAASRTQLERYCGRLERATGAQLAIVTIDTLGDDSIEDFATSLFGQWGIGKKGKDEGVLLLLVTKDRKSRIEVGYGLEGTLPDGFVSSVLREMRPSFKEGNDAQALMAGAAHIGQTIAQAKGVSLDRDLTRRAPSRSRGGGLPWPLIVIGIFILLSLLSRGGGGGGGIGSFLTGMLLGNILGGGRRGGGDDWGGGGFGGGDSGGGFGGFGGGDSGGGGSSDSW